MNLFRCDQCEWTFEDPVLVPDGQSLEVWGAKVWKDDSFQACPRCESDHFSPVLWCADCGNGPVAVGDDECCKGCRAKRDLATTEEPSWLGRQAW